MCWGGGARARSSIVPLDLRPAAVCATDSIAGVISVPPWILRRPGRSAVVKGHRHRAVPL